MTKPLSSQWRAAWEKTFRYAAKHSPYYRDLFGRTKKIPSWQEIPTVDKTILSRRNLDFLCVPQERIVEVVTTSGTTGDPIAWMLTESDLQRLAAGDRRAFANAGLTRRDTVLLAVTLDRCFIAGMAYALGLRALGCATIRAGPSSPLLVLNCLKRFRPTAIVAVPSFLRIVADKARETKFDLKNCSIRKAICIGEPIRDSDFQLNSSGQFIESTWGAKVFSTYGVTELSQACCECAAGKGAHIPQETLHLEILDEAGRSLPDGEIGEVVATTFGVEAMPLIRYRTGDCAAIFSKRCICGMTSPRLGPIVGRKQHKLKIKGASVFPSALQSILENARGVKHFTVIATAENELSDAVEIIYDGTARAETLRDLIQAGVKISPRVRRVAAAKMAALQLPPDARKRQWFIDRRNRL
ncbi:MAG: AMP-binding protein [Verrucomicrobiota bacterium]